MKFRNKITHLRKIIECKRKTNTSGKKQFGIIFIVSSIITIFSLIYASNNPEEHALFSILLVTSVLAPIYGVQMLLGLSLEPDIKYIKTSHEIDIKRINVAVSDSSTQRVGTAESTAEIAFSRAVNAKHVINTFVIQKSPYKQKTNTKIQDLILKWINKDEGSWIETVSEYGFERLTELAPVLHNKPGKRNFFINKVASKDGSYFPICNYMILEFDDEPPEIFFGWGFFAEQSSDADVFWSNDTHLVQYFKSYHEALRDYSERIELSTLYKPPTNRK
jgi:hypothetical protein